MGIFVYFLFLLFFCEEKSRNPSSCYDTEIRTHVPTSEGFEVTNSTTGATGYKYQIKPKIRSKNKALAEKKSNRTLVLFFAGGGGVYNVHSFGRDVCSMDDLCKIDSTVSDEALVCIMVSTAGENIKNLKHVLLGAYIQGLWWFMVHTNRQLQVTVLYEKGRHEVKSMKELP